MHPGHCHFWSVSDPPASCISPSVSALARTVTSVNTKQFMLQSDFTTNNVCHSELWLVQLPNALFTGNVWLKILKLYTGCHNIVRCHNIGRFCQSIALRIISLKRNIKVYKVED